MSVSLFRRWRSQKFSDLVGQESVVSTLQNVLGAGDTARAYLFCGPRGTGKTSSARIFAKALNCERGPAPEPCNECSQCVSISDGSNLDVFEIDAASNTQVDKIRDFIVEKVHFTPVAARYKVYIIDEVHKLSTSSFNALLKTLEEPPSHVVFVLATTHPHEMPSTILSRCQRYDFRPLTAMETEEHLNMIASQESIELDQDAARQLARAADGSLRDALVLFEQASLFSEGRVSRDKVLDLLGGVGYEVLEEMFTDLGQGQAARALSRLDEWVTRGRDLKRLAESFQNHLRMMLLLKVKSEDQSIKHLSLEERESLERLVESLSAGAIAQWLKAVGEMLGEIRHGRRARLEWEMLLVALACPETNSSVEGLERRIERLESGGLEFKAEGSRPEDSKVDDSVLLERLKVLETKFEEPAKGGGAAESERVQLLEAKVLALQGSLEALVSTGVVSPEKESRSLERDSERAIDAFSGEKPEAKELALSPELVASASLSQGLKKDIVDEWFVMPEVLVSSRIKQSGQISLMESELPTNPPSSKKKTEVPKPKPEREPVVEPELKEEPRITEAREPVNKTDQAPVAPVSEPPDSKHGESSPALPDPKEFFRLMMQQVKEKDIRLHAVLADAQLTRLTAEEFELAVPAGYDWHFQKIQDGKQLLETVAQQFVSNANIQMACRIGGEKASPPKENEHEELVKRASGVFGGSAIIE